MLPFRQKSIPVLARDRSWKPSNRQKLTSRSRAQADDDFFKPGNQCATISICKTTSKAAITNDPVTRQNERCSVSQKAGMGHTETSSDIMKLKRLQVRGSTKVATSTTFPADPSPVNVLTDRFVLTEIKTQPMEDLVSSIQMRHALCQRSSELW